MKPTLLILLFAGLFQACAPIAFAPQPKSPISCLGSVGKLTSKPFTKSFQKVGEPNLEAPVALTIHSLPITASIQSKLDKYRSQAAQTEASYADAEEQPNRYFQARIADAVGLVAELNSPVNQHLKNYLQHDKHLVLLTGISFVADAVTAQKIGTAEHYFVSEVNGSLILELYGNLGKSHIGMSALQIFDFETSGICWKHSKRNQPEIATILMEGNSCPGNTEKDPTKLDGTQKYWKL